MLLKQHLWSLFILIPFSLTAQSTSVLAPPPPETVKAAISAFHEYANGQTLDDILKLPSSKVGPIVIARSFDPSPGGGIRREATYPSLLISRLVAQSDFVGTGRPLKRWSFATAENTFAISIYLVRIESVAIAGPQHVTVGSEIYVARAGGPIEYLGRAFRAIDPEFRLFHLNQEYLFFGSAIGVGSYKVDSDRAFEVHETGLVESAVHPRHYDFFKARTRASVLSEAFAAWEQIPPAARRQQ